MHETLTASLQKGDKQAFEDFVNAFKNKAFSLAVKILKNEQDAEDCVQESFLKLYRALVKGQFESRAKLSTYFYSIVYNTAIEMYKKVTSKSFSIISVDAEGPVFNEGDELTYNIADKLKLNKESNKSMDTASVNEANEIQQLVNAYISNIPEQYSIILNMFFINQLSHEEIANILELPVGTVKNRIFRAKDKLKKLILDNFNAEEILEYV